MSLNAGNHAFTIYFTHEYTTELQVLSSGICHVVQSQMIFLGKIVSPFSRFYSKQSRNSS
jgi:hypothetical protein